MGQSTESQARKVYQNARLPLAVYREVVAHLSQVTGVEVGLLPQTATVFDYTLSQVGGLWLAYTSAANPESERRVGQILNYYGDRYGHWEVRHEA